MKKARNPPSGSTLGSFLEEKDLLADAAAGAIKSVIARQLQQAMRSAGLTKKAMAERLRTSRSQLDRLLDPENEGVTLAMLMRAARAVGKRVKVDLVDA
jgi:hypothetical protein